MVRDTTEEMVQIVFEHKYVTMVRVAQDHWQKVEQLATFNFKTRLLCCLHNDRVGLGRKLGRNSQSTCPGVKRERDLVPRY